MARVRNASNVVAQWYPRLLYTARPLVVVMLSRVTVETQGDRTSDCALEVQDSLPGTWCIFPATGSCSACEAQTLEVGLAMQIAAQTYFGFQIGGRCLRMTTA